MKTKNLEPILLLDENRGIYIPKEFYERYNNNENVNFNVSDEVLNDLSDVENEFYWESWDEILDNCILFIDNNKYTLYQNGNLWAVPEGSDILDDYNF